MSRAFSPTDRDQSRPESADFVYARLSPVLGIPISSVNCSPNRMMLLTFTSLQSTQISFHFQAKVHFIFSSCFSFFQFVRFFEKCLHRRIFFFTISSMSTNVFKNFFGFSSRSTRLCMNDSKLRPLLGVSRSAVFAEVWYRYCVYFSLKYEFFSSSKQESS